MREPTLELVLSILKVIQQDAKVDRLLKNDFNYYNLSQEMNKLKKNNLISDSLGTLEVTRYGYEEIKRIEEMLDYSNIEKMIIPDFKYCVEKQSSLKVYLP